MARVNSVAIQITVVDPPRLQVTAKVEGLRKVPAEATAPDKNVKTTVIL